MEFYDRRLLLLNEDVPISTAIPPLPHFQNTTNSSSPPRQQPPSTTSEKPLQLFIRPILTSNAAYLFVVIFTVIFFAGLVYLYIHQFSAGGSLRRRHAPNTAAAKSLPVVSYGGEEKQGECAICLEEFGDGDAVKVIPYCKHVFHPQCIDTWLLAHVTCPICRCSKLCASRMENGEGMVGSVSVREEEEEEETEAVNVVVPNLD
ncbi:hypothetical protein RJT34_29796 [Clitoria ternatea]|uniref:RING-type E3 ubiquitin transferase n=1 Tax=Clitoria ternatea TaxID=43366 RepID=A0AAN9EYV1_CLITE